MASLRAERDEAREEVRYLREAITPSPLIEYDMLRISRSERAILEALLAAKGLLSVEQLRRHIDAALGRADVVHAKSVHVALCRLRVRLGELRPPVLVRTQWGLGYYLDDENKARIAARRSIYNPTKVAR